jgi:hypothetical protein
VQHKAYARGFCAALITALATGCTAEPGDRNPAVDAKAGQGTMTVAQPGKYRTLLEPCDSISDAVLEKLLPAAAELEGDQRQKLLRGVPESTFDNDRRAGCDWKADAPDAAHSLTLDFERVVSYDSAVSDDARAQELFAVRQAAAGVPVVTDTPSSPAGGTPSSTGTAPGTADTGGTDGATGGPGTTDGTENAASGGNPGSQGDPAVADSSGAAGQGAVVARHAVENPQGTAGAGFPGTTASGAAATADSTGADTAGADSNGADTGSPGTGTGTPEELRPRALDDLGDAAFIDDRLTSKGAGPALQRRTVSVVFRTSNVIVTLVYTESSTVAGTAPDSAELQDRAQGVARDLVQRFSE